jgi:hypothetical protein
MNLNTYRFHASHLFNAWNYGGVLPTLTRNGLVQTLAGVGIRDLTAAPNGGYEAHVELGRATHQAEVTEWATATVEGALLGGTGGGAIGSATKDPLGFLAGLALGAVVGAVVGHAAQTIKARYRADRIAPGMWQFTQLPVPRPGFGTQPWGAQP